MSAPTVFVARIAGAGVFDPAGERIGKVRDVVTVPRQDASPRVVGLVVEDTNGAPSAHVVNLRVYTD